MDTPVVSGKRGREKNNSPKQKKGSKHLNDYKDIDVLNHIHSHSYHRDFRRQECQMKENMFMM